MTYDVIYVDTFTRDLDQMIEYLLAEHATVPVIEQWLTRLYDVVDGLRTYPSSFPIDSRQTQVTGRETRKINLGSYLIFYQVD